MEIVNTDNAPKAIGPYSQAVKANGFLFCSGQIPLNKEGDLIEGDVKDQCKQVLKNLKAVVEAAGSDLSKVVKTTIYLSDMNNFVAVNEVYAEYFNGNKPARATVAVKTLPKNVDVEIDCVAIA